MKEFIEALRAHFLAQSPCEDWNVGGIASEINAFAASWPTSEHNPANYAPSFDESEFAELTRKGKEAWADVPSATEFVEELRGNTPAKEEKIDTLTNRGDAIDTSPAALQIWRSSR